VTFFSNHGGEFESGSSTRMAAACSSSLTSGAPCGMRSGRRNGAHLAYTIAGQCAFIMDTNRSWKEQSPEPLPAWNEPDSTFYPYDWSPDGKTLVGDIAKKDGTTGIGIYVLATRKFERLTDFGSYPQWLGR